MVPFGIMAFHHTPHTQITEMGRTVPTQSPRDGVPSPSRALTAIETTPTRLRPFNRRQPGGARRLAPLVGSCVYSIPNSAVGAHRLFASGKEHDVLMLERFVKRIAGAT